MEIFSLKHYMEIKYVGTKCPYYKPQVTSGNIFY